MRIRIRQHYVDPDSQTWFDLAYISDISRWYRPEAEFLDEIQTKILRVFLLVIHSHFRSFACDYFFKLTQPNTVSTVHTAHCEEKGGKPYRKPYPLPYMV
jgi:hypothetical protein